MLGRVTVRAWGLFVFFFGRRVFGFGLLVFRTLEAVLLLDLRFLLLVMGAFGSLCGALLEFRSTTEGNHSEQEHTSKAGDTEWKKGSREKGRRSNIKITRLLFTNNAAAKLGTRSTHVLIH